jgi:hypothetical protein
LFPDAEFPFVEETRSHEVMAQIAKRFAVGRESTVRLSASPDDLQQKESFEAGSEEIDWRKPVLSIAWDESFGCAGYVVGYSVLAGVAAVLFTNEGESFSDFGCATIGKNIGKVVPLDRLLQL